MSFASVVAFDDATFHTSVAVMAIPPKKSPRGIQVSEVKVLLFVAVPSVANPMAEVPLEDTPKTARVTASAVSLNIIHLRPPKSILLKGNKNYELLMCFLS